jgi:hypothetical protein
MHLLGRWIKVTIAEPGAATRTLIHVPQWDFNWQETYSFREPLVIKAGTRLQVEASYDNSPQNPSNPHSPPVPVRWGEQTTDEMCFVFFGATSDEPGPIGYETLDSQGWTVLQPYRYYFPPLEVIAAGVNALAGRGVLLAANLTLIAWLLLRRPRLAAAVVLELLIGGFLLVQGVTWLESFSHPKTTDAPRGLIDEPTFLATMTYLTLALVVAGLGTPVRVRRVLVPVGVLLALLIGLSQLYLRSVYPSEVILAWLGGLAVALACRWAVRKCSEPAAPARADLAGATGSG